MGKEYVKKDINMPFLIEKPLKRRRDRNIYIFSKSKQLLSLFLELFFFFKHIFPLKFPRKKTLPRTKHFHISKTEIFCVCHYQLVCIL